MSINYALLLPGNSKIFSMEEKLFHIVMDQNSLIMLSQDTQNSQINKLLAKGTTILQLYIYILNS